LRCGKEEDEDFSYAPYTITFAAASNGFVGFSALDHALFTEITYVVLPSEGFCAGGPVVTVIELTPTQNTS